MGTPLLSTYEMQKLIELQARASSTRKLAIEISKWQMVLGII